MTVFDTHWLIAAIAFGSPLLLAATGEVVAQRSGVLNVGLEGMMLVGAFTAFYVAVQTDSVMSGVIAASVAAAAMAALVGILVVFARADQIVVGIGVNLLALGATTSLFRQSFSGVAPLDAPRLEPVPIPVLANLPVLGQALFTQSLLVYFSWIFVAVVAYILARTRAGLLVRGAGEQPATVDAAGVSVNKIRVISTIVAGASAGLGGALLSLSLGSFVEEMTGGRGFLAIAAVIFGRWRPGGVVAGCLIFGGADALQRQLQSQAGLPRELWAVFAVCVLVVALLRLWQLRGSDTRGRPPAVAAIFVIVLGAAAVVQPSVTIPSQLWAAVPYLLALVALVVLPGGGRMPSALSVPYDRRA